jgi:iron(III) transport system permease protein
VHRDWSRSLVLGTAWLIFTVCCLLPLAWMLLASNDSASFEIFVIELSGARQRSLLINTLALGGGVASLALVVGVPLGLLLGRCDTKRSHVPRILLTLPLVLPSYVLALVWIVLFGVHKSEWVYSLPAGVAVLGLSLYPLVMLTAEASLRNIPARLEEAARLVASPWRTWKNVIFPLMMPAIGASTLIVFVLAVSEFAVPSLLRIRVYTTEVFTAFAALYDSRRATLIAIPLLAVAAVVSLVAVRLVRHPVIGRADRAPAAAVWIGRKERIARLVLMAAGVLALAIPTGALLREATSGHASLTDAISMDAIRNSFAWSMTGASLVVLVGSILAYWRTRMARRSAYAVDSLFLALFAVPATVLGVGVIALWNRPGLAGTIYQSDLIVLVAYLGRFLPVAALLCAAFLRMVPSAVEEAASMAGASWMRSLRGIVLPMAARGLAAVWLIIFILLLGDVGVTILVAPPGESTIPVRAYTLIANSPTSDVARLGLLQIVVNVLPMVAIGVLLWRLSESQA